MPLFYFGLAGFSLRTAPPPRPCQPRGRPSPLLPRSLAPGLLGPRPDVVAARRLAGRIAAQRLALKAAKALNTAPSPTAKNPSSKRAHRARLLRSASRRLSRARHAPKRRQLPRSLRPQIRVGSLAVYLPPPSHPAPEACPPLPPVSAAPPLPWRGGGLKEAIEALTPTAHRDTITSPLLESLAAPFRRSLERYPWSVPAIHHPFLQQCGINASGFGFKAHPHPVHKTLETHLLHDQWPSYASTASSVLFMKPEKFAKLQRQQPNFAELHNYRLTPKDTTRYPETSTHLPDCETVFMHDALMYFRPSQILDLFRRIPRLQKLYASLVVPPESSFSQISLFPELYRFRFEGQSLVYELENNPAHNYTQPREALEWLSTSTILGPDFSLTVSRLDSWGPVHSLLIQRGESPLHSRVDSLDFRVPEAVALPAPASLDQDLRDRLVPKKVYDALFIYVRAVRTLRVTDPAGFVRTQCSKPEYSWVTASAWDNLGHFALQTASHRPRTTFYLFDSALARVAHWCRTHTLLLGWFTAAGATPLLSLAGWHALDLRRHEVNSFALARRWITPPPISCFPRNLPGSS